MSSSLAQRDLYHIGIVVDDFDAACEDYARSLGLTWSPVIEVGMDVWLAGQGIKHLDFKAVYSVEAPHIEIVQAIPGTPSVPVPGRPMHHLGYWSDDLAADSQRLEALGNPRIMCPLAEGKPVGFVFHALPDGTLIELVDRGAFADWQAFLENREVFKSAV
ncbi:VOC family protein [Novosphingobium sp. PASSN1]|uniref:VOC family protein n=1 Tax=Novosphingobium sp. PASSN1 TaxID=2015561 RepID=UPI000BC75478|nr:VOC family protein [Novosphingobium sp. PASSN1]OYU34806.1 MAG: bleomycin resistance protein [Novosphingobium sp. PASSN1]